MTPEQFTQEDGQIVRRYEYDECSVLAVDFGADSASASVDTVDDTVIVVIDSAERSRSRDGDAVSRDDENRRGRFSNHSADRSGGKPPEDGEQYEFELPDGADDAHTFIKNGVLTIEMEADL